MVVAEGAWQLSAQRRLRRHVRRMRLVGEAAESAVAGGKRMPGDARAAPAGPQPRMGRPMPLVFSMRAPSPLELHHGGCLRSRGPKLWPYKRG